MEVKSGIKFQTKKVLCVGVPVANVGMTEEQIRQNISITLNFLISLLRKGWQNIKGLVIKSSMGKPERLL